MVSSSTLLAVAVAVLAVGLVASVVAAGVLVRFVVSNRHERLARHQSVRTYDGRMALSH
jgi:hypothetical protein